MKQEVAEELQNVDGKVWTVKSYHYDIAMRLFQVTIIDGDGNELNITPAISDDDRLILQVV